MLWLVLVIALAACLQCRGEAPSFHAETSFQRKLRDNEYSIFSLAKSDTSNAPSIDQEREQLYEAYNLLHTLAQDFHKPFDAPAVIVVGHQTSGKSALIEAIMGFQFNQVGGGTKTRRPIALRMQYNPNCVTPLCFLTLENGKEEQRSLQDIQAYIEAENKRLEKDPSRSFDPREINIRMEYKYCPNMIVIDTPGMIHPPKGRHLTPQQRALAQAAREAEALVLSKIRCQDYIILCVEDTTDWKHATTRNVVMQADPQLLRTVLVSTKLDTKVPQFSEAEDLEDYLRAPLIHQLFSQMLGGPFFTSVPSGRVGQSKDFESNEDFVDSIRRAERNDRGAVLAKMGPVSARASLQCVGVSRLRTFLEARVEDCYRRNVAKIVPLLQSELRLTESKLAATEAELNALSMDRLRQAANEYRESFAKELANVIQGTVRASPEEWGETLELEQLRGGSFLAHQQPTFDRDASEGRSTSLGGSKGRGARASAFGDEAYASSHGAGATGNAAGRSLAPQDWQRVALTQVAHAQAKLFGGAQYHRAMKEFALAVRHLRTPAVSEDEIANAAGMGDTHNGVNFMRAACVIAMEKARQSFDPALEALAQRSEHIMKRLFPIVQHLVRTSSASSASSSVAMHIQVRPFQEIVRRIYERFIEETLRECVVRCKDDLSGMTDYVTFDIEERGGSLGSGADGAMYSTLPTPRRVAEIWQMAVDRRQQQTTTPSPLHPADSGVSLEADEDEAEAEDEEETSSTRPSSAVEEDDDDDDVAVFGRSRRPSGRSGAGPTGRRPGGASVLDRVMEEWTKANDPQRQTKRSASVVPRRRRSSVSASSAAKSLKTKRAASTMAAATTATTVPPHQQLVAMPAAVEEDAMLSDYYRVVQLTEEMVSGSSATRTSALVTAIVEYIVSAWRMYFARTTAMKFNSFFLMSFVKRFPLYLREELDKVYRGEMSEVFDMTEARRELSLRREQLLAEADANNRLQQRFDAIAQQLRKASSSSATSSSATSSSATSAAGGGDERGRDAAASESSEDEDLLADLHDVRPPMGANGTRRRRVASGGPSRRVRAPRDGRRQGDEVAAGGYSAANVDVHGGASGVAGGDASRPDASTETRTADVSSAEPDEDGDADGSSASASSGRGGGNGGGSRKR